jgi:hypothetical protein
MYAEIRSRDFALQRSNGERNYYGQDECMKKKKFKGFPLFITLKISKQL